MKEPESRPNYQRDQSRKFDGEKPMMELIPPSTFRSLGKVLTHGAHKYAPHSWKTIEDAIPRYTGALLRHYTDFLAEPTGKDKDSGFYHIEHLLCNAVFLNELVQELEAKKK